MFRPFKIQVSPPLGTWNVSQAAAVIDMLLLPHCRPPYLTHHERLYMSSPSRTENEVIFFTVHESYFKGELASQRAPQTDTIIQSFTVYSQFILAKICNDSASPHKAIRGFLLSNRATFLGAWSERGYIFFIQRLGVVFADCAIT